MVRGLDSLSYSDRLRNLNLDTLYYRRRRTDVMQVFRLIKKIDNISFHDFFQVDQGITRGNDYKLFKPRADSSTKQHCFSHRVINDWNELPNYVVNSESLNAFKSNLKTFWLDKEFKFEFDFK